MPVTYHLSQNPDLKILIPAIPSKLLTRSNAFEETETKRISFSSSINGCILGLQLTNFVDGEIELFAYVPIKGQKLKWKTNQELIDERLVFDAHITKEFWCLESVCVSLIGSITVYNNVIEEIEYSPLKIGNPKFLNKNNKLISYRYKYKWNN